MEAHPAVSIGLPVRNGGQYYLAKVIDSILSQTFHEFELIVCDNASTDSTEEVCKEAAARDSRVRYYRNEQNIGVSRNHNLAYHLSRGKYFAWATDDRFYSPSRVETCFNILESNREYVLCYTAIDEYSEAGESVNKELWEPDIPTDSDSASERFRYLVCCHHPCYQQYGLIRSDILRKTNLQLNYPVGDKVLIAELGLYGKFYRHPEPLLHGIEHDHGVWTSERVPQKILHHFWPEAPPKRIYPHFRWAEEYLRAVARSELPPAEKSHCYFQILRWLKWHWKDLGADLAYVLAHPGVKRDPQIGSSAN